MPKKSLEIVCFAHAVTQKNHKVSGFAEYILKKIQADECSKNIHSFTALSLTGIQVTR